MTSTYVHFEFDLVIIVWKSRILKKNYTNSWEIKKEVISTFYTVNVHIWIYIFFIFYWCLSSLWFDSFCYTILLIQAIITTGFYLSVFIYSFSSLTIVYNNNNDNKQKFIFNNFLLSFLSLYCKFPDSCSEISQNIPDRY